MILIYVLFCIYRHFVLMAFYLYQTPVTQESL